MAHVSHDYSFFRPAINFETRLWGDTVTKTDFKGADLLTLVKQYREAAVAHGTASFNGNYKIANRNAKTIINIYRELRRRGREAQNSILPLLNDEDLNVRAWAGGHALEFAPEQGEPVLLELTKLGPGLHRLDAEVCLEQWRNGTLKFP